jgi:hypothetical protein
MTFQVLAGMEHGMVLDTACDKVVALFAEGSGATQNGQVVTFGSPTGENNLTGTTMQRSGHPIPGVIE